MKSLCAVIVVNRVIYMKTASSCTGQHILHQPFLWKTIKNSISLQVCIWSLQLILFFSNVGFYKIIWKLSVFLTSYKHFTGQMKNIHRTRPDVPSPKRPRWSERKSNSTRYFNNSIDYSGQSQSTPVHVNRNANASGSFNHNGISPSKFDGVSNTPGHYKKKFKRLNKDLKKKRHSTSPCNFNNNYKSPSSEKKKKKRHKNSPNFKNKNKSRRVDDINNTI